jgi:hypothetical protein
MDPMPPFNNTIPKKIPDYETAIRARLLDLHGHHLHEHENCKLCREHERLTADLNARAWRNYVAPTN